MMLTASDVDIRLGGRLVLKAAEFAISAGEIVAVVGPNGAGKSTLLKALAGLVQPERGEVAIDGRALSAWDKGELGRAVSYLPQEGRVYWPLSVRSVVALGRIPHRERYGAVSAADAKAVDAAMLAMDVAAFAERSVGTLSGGERARVLLARSLAQGARLLIADEPTAGLDPGHVLAMFEHFARLSREGRAIVVALHDLSAAVRYCHRLVLLKDGGVIAAGTPRAVLTRERLAEAYGIDGELRDIDGVPAVIARALLPARTEAPAIAPNGTG